MPVHIVITDQPAFPRTRARPAATKPNDLLIGSWFNEKRSTFVQHNSFSGCETDFSKTYSVWGGFVGAVVTAYIGRHHLVIRPDDVWMAMVAQFHMYKSGSAEYLKKSFVPKPKNALESKHLRIVVNQSFNNVDQEQFEKQARAHLEGHLVNQELKGWILPDFSTTTRSDRIICLLYFSSPFIPSCQPGSLKDELNLKHERYIPSITLEGTKEDWNSLLGRLDKLKSEFGIAAMKWATLLDPILKRFVRAFDGQVELDFWKSACSIKKQWSWFTVQDTELCGWITAFCVWSPSSIWQGPPVHEGPSKAFWCYDMSKLVMECVRYKPVSIYSVAAGVWDVERCVEVRFDGLRKLHKREVVYGITGIVTEGEHNDTVRPLPAWYTVDSERFIPGNLHILVDKY